MEARSAKDFVESARKLVAEGQSDEALNTLQIAVSRHPFDGGVHRTLVETYMGLGRHMDAFRAGVQWFRTEPTNPACLEVLAQCADHLGRPQEAERWRNQARVMRASQVAPVGPQGPIRPLGDAPATPAAPPGNSPSDSVAAALARLRSGVLSSAAPAAPSPAAMAPAPSPNPRPASATSLAPEPTSSPVHTAPMTFTLVHPCRTRAELEQLQSALARFTTAWRAEPNVQLVVVPQGASAADAATLAQGVQAMRSGGAMCQLIITRP